MADDIRYLLVPGRGIPGPGHWPRRWAGARPDFRWAPEPPGPHNPPGWTPGPDDPPDLVSFAVPRERLPFPTTLVASRTDPYTSFEQFEQYAEDWSSELVDVGNAGHLETASGYGPWPAGEQLVERLVER